VLESVFALKQHLLLLAMFNESRMLENIVLRVIAGALLFQVIGQVNLDVLPQDLFDTAIKALFSFGA